MSAFCLHHLTSQTSIAQCQEKIPQPARNLNQKKMKMSEQAAFLAFGVTI